MKKYFKNGMITLLICTLLLPMTVWAEVSDTPVFLQADIWNVDGKPYTATCDISQNSPDLIKIAGKEYHGKVFSFLSSESGSINVSWRQVSGNIPTVALTTVDPTLKDATEGDCDISRSIYYSYPQFQYTGFRTARLLVKANQRVWLAVYGTENTFSATVQFSVSALSSRVGRLPIIPEFVREDGTCQFSVQSKELSTYIMPFVAPATGALDVHLLFYGGICNMYLRDVTKKVTTKVYKVMNYANDEGEAPVHYKFGVIRNRKYELIIKYQTRDGITEEDRCFYNLSISGEIESVKYPTGTTRAKAEFVKKRKVKNGLLTPSIGTRWYKIKINKKGKVSFQFDTATTGTTKYKIYNSKGKEVLKGTTKRGIGHLSPDYANEARLLKSGTLKAGTYYVKVYGTKGNSGKYSLSYK